jgi:SAM-dependent methyltransferase
MVCADVGAGIGTVARWLSGAVGPTGRVVATDIEVRWLEALSEPNLEIRRANILSDPLGDDEFDLIHARALLANVDAEIAVRNMVAALRPGGTLIVADPDFGTAGMVYPPVESLERYWSALASAILRSGGDPYVGRKLPHLLRTAGLIEIDAASLIFLRWTEDAYVATVKHVAPMLTASGLLPPDVLAAIEALPRGDDSFLYGVSAFVASGRKPLRQ